jgi:hypothetical protein
MSKQSQIQERITYLQGQLDSLEHFLPETYQYLMDEMDIQHRHLMELKVQDFYATQDHESQTMSHINLTQKINSSRPD